MQSPVINNNFRNQNNGSKVGLQVDSSTSTVTSSTSSFCSLPTHSTSATHFSQPLVSNSSSNIEVIQATDFTLIKSHVTKYHSVRVDLAPTRTVHNLHALPFPAPAQLSAPIFEAVHHGQCPSSALQNVVAKPLITYPIITSPPPSTSDYAILSPSAARNKVFPLDVSSSATSSSGFTFDEEADKLVVVPPEIPPRTCNHLNHKSPFELSQSSHRVPSGNTTSCNPVKNCNKNLANTSQSNQIQLQNLKQILSADTILEDQLQQLLLEFVREEKMRQESKNMSGSKKSSNTQNPFPSSSLADRRSLSMSSLNQANQPNYSPTDYYIRGRSSHNSSPKVAEPHHRPNNFLFNLFNRSFSIPNSHSSQVHPNQIKSIAQPKKAEPLCLQQQPSQAIEKSPSVTRKTLAQPNNQKQTDANDPKTMSPSPSAHVLSKTGNKLGDPSGKVGLTDKNSKGKPVENVRQQGSPANVVTPQVPSRGMNKNLSRSTEQLNPTPTSSGSTVADSNIVPVKPIGADGKVVVKKKVKRSSSLDEKGGDENAEKKKKERKTSINVMNNPFEQVLNEVLQLTDDEKACILASHQQSLNQSLKQQRKADFVQQQQMLLESKLQPKSTNQFNNNNTSNGNPHTNLNKKKSFSSDSLSNKKLLVDFDSMINNPTAINYSNPIDYARTRFINSFVSSSKNPSPNPSFVDFNHPALKSPTQQLVNEAKSKWELPKNLNNPTNVQPIQPKEKLLSKQDKITLTQRRLLNLNDPAKNPVKPFLSRGSVAERVLLFEKCPEVKSTRVLRDHRKNKSHPLYNTWRGSHFGNDDNNQNEADKAPRELVRRKSRTGTSVKNSLNPGDLTIPRFHFPNGRPYTSLEIEEKIKKIKGEFEKLPAKCILSKLEMTRITKACDVPLYWKEPIRLAVLAARANRGTDCSNQNPATSSLNLNETNANVESNKITCNEFLDFWKKLLASSYEESSRFVKLLTKGDRNYLVHDDFIPMIQDVVESHPGLLFLKDAIEFHSRYVHTVIARIFYCVNKSWSGKISIPELRKSNFLSVVAALEEEDDINQITDYFSYEHFYVIYCKFWELDKDHDLIIDKHDLSKHNDGTISVRMIDRIFSGAVTRGPVHKYGKMTYTEFVWFLIAEEDKRHPRSIEYWFRCMDLDGDGYLSMFELEFFYSEQVRRMDAMGIEALPFNDALCQMLDMVSPENQDKISLADLKRCRMTPVFFDTFFNLDKYLDHEQKDPFSNNKNEEEMSDWDKFAAEEYELLVAEENVHQPGKGGRSNSVI